MKPEIVYANILGRTMRCEVIKSITVSKMDRPEQSGDWHDKPLKWKVEGPGKEIQKFSTKSDATRYKRIRSHASTEQEAHTAFVLA